MTYIKVRSTIAAAHPLLYPKEHIMFPREQSQAALWALHAMIASVLYPWVNCTGIRTLNPGFRGSPSTHGYKTDPIMIHNGVTGLCA